MRQRELSQLHGSTSLSASAVGPRLVPTVEDSLCPVGISDVALKKTCLKADVPIPKPEPVCTLANVLERIPRGA